MNMFISFSKMMEKTRLRFGVGLRITKKNAVWMWFVLMLYWVIALCWYTLVICFWMVYAVCYGFYALIKWIIKKIKGNKTQSST